MAFIILTNNKGMTMPYKKAVQLKAIMDGTEQGTLRQKAFASHVKKIYMGRQHQPVDVAEPYWQR